MRCEVAALDDSAGSHQADARNDADRDEFMRQAAARKLKPIPSCTNFVVMETGRPIRGLIDDFLKNDIEVGRAFPPMATFARVSLATPPQMECFWSAGGMRAEQGIVG